MEWYSLFFIFFYSMVIMEASYTKRKEFQEKLCKLRPLLSSCASVYTVNDYKRELMKHKNNGTLKGAIVERPIQSSSGTKKDRKRSAWWRNSDEDDDYEYYLWKKYRRDKFRKEHRLSSPSSSNEVENHYHYHYNNPYRSYYHPSSYPSYGSYGGGYGGYGGYGGGLGQLFSIGGGRQLGISTPIGGFGYSSGFGIGIG